MNNFYLIRPAVYGEMGPRSIVDRSSHPPDVAKLHLVLDRPPTDDLHTCFPCHLASDRLVQAINDRKLSGTRIDSVEVTAAAHFPENQRLPLIFMLRIDGRPHIDDFGVDQDGHLVVSQNAMDVLKSLSLNEALVYDAHTKPTAAQMTEDLWADAERAAESARKRRRSPGSTA